MMRILGGKYMNWRKRKKLRRIAQHHGFTHYYDFKFYIDTYRINSKIYDDPLLALEMTNILCSPFTPLPKKELIKRSKLTAAKYEPVFKKKVT
jgi:hypothetical protein